jgi:RimK family alpha-L-glutamate ligase
MEVGLVSNDRRMLTPGVRWLVGRLKELNVEHRLIVPAQTLMEVHHDGVRMVDGGNESIPDIVINALGSASGKGLIIVECCEALGIPVLNRAAAWRNAKLKPLASVLFRLHGIPHPPTIFSVGWPSWATDYASTRLKEEIIEKPWRGAKGIGIRYISSHLVLRRRLHRERRPSYVYLQEYIRHPGRHIRVLVVGGQALGAIYRIHRRGQLITSEATGFGEPAPCPLDHDLADVAVRATEALGLDIAGVDVVEDGNQYSVLEVNSWPAGHVDFREATGISIADEIADYAMARADAAYRNGSE